MSIKLRAHKLADKLRELPRDEHDLAAATMLEKLVAVYDVAAEMVFAKTNEHSRAAYAEMLDLIKGKKID